MSNIDKLLALGAESCGGDLIWKHKLLGRLRNGVLDLTEEGEKALAMDVTDVEPKEDKPKKPRAPKAKPVAEAEDVVDSDPEIELE